MYLYHMKAYQVMVSMCHIPGSGSGDKYDIYQVPVSNIKYRGSGIKYNISSVGAINRASSITCQVSGKSEYNTIYKLV